MTPEQFAYWLQGFAELNSQPPTAEQWESVKDHLQTVFHKVTPAVLPEPPGYDQFQIGRWRLPYEVTCAKDLIC